MVSNESMIAHTTGKRHAVDAECRRTFHTVMEGLKSQRDSARLL